MIILIWFFIANEVGPHYGYLNTRAPLARGVMAGWVDALVSGYQKGTSSFLIKDTY